MSLWIIVLAIVVGASAATAQTCETKVDLWFLNDESGSVDSQEFAHAQSFMQKVGQDLIFDPATGFQAALISWSNDQNQDIEIDLGTTFNTSITNYTDSRLSGNSYATYPGAALDYVSNGITNYVGSAYDGDGGTGPRAGAGQIVVLLTDADGLPSTSSSGGYIRDEAAMTTAATALRNAGVEIVIMLADEAATQYSNSPSFKTFIDTSAGTANNVIVGDTYAEIADPTKGHIANLSTKLCSVASSISGTPEITVTKTADQTTIASAAVNDVISYTITVENTGSVDLTSVTLTDDLTTNEAWSSSDAGDTDDTGTLNTGETWTYTASYSLTQADIDAGFVENVAYATAFDGGTSITAYSAADAQASTSTTAPSAGSGVVTTLTPNPSLHVVKTQTTANPAVGVTLDWDIVVTNDGNVTLSNISLADTLKRLNDPVDANRTTLTLLSGPTAGTWPGTAGELAPGQSVTFDAKYTLVQDDINAGGVSNSAIATGSSPGNSNDVTDTSGTASNNDNPTETLISPDGKLSVTKVFNSATLQTPAVVGDEVTWTVMAENTGNVLLDELVLSDTLTAGTVYTLADAELTASAASVASIAPGATATWTVAYQLTQADIDAGSLSNTATVTASTPNGSGDVSDVSDGDGSLDGNGDSDLDNDPTITTLDQNPMIEGIKTSAITTNVGPSELSDGDTITYTITAENTGNVTLANVSITSETLSRGTAGSLTPVLDGTSNPVLKPSDFTTTDNTTLVAPGGIVTWTADYSVAQADIDAGGLSNTATVAGTPPTGPDVSDITDDDGTAQSDPTDDAVNQTASIALVKTGTVNLGANNTLEAGDTISYGFSVTNTGNVTLYDVKMTDPKVTVVGGPIASLAPGASDNSTFTASYIVTQSDIDAGSVTNQATARAEAPGGSPTDATDDVTDTSGTGIGNDDPTITPLAQSPAVLVLKTSSIADTSGNNITDAGDTITYAFTVENTGNVTLENVVLSEPQINFTGVGTAPVPVYLSGDTNSDTKLDLDEVWVYSAEYVLQSGDVDSSAIGYIENQAVVTAVVPGSGGTLQKTSTQLRGSDDETVTFLGSVTGTLIENSTPVAGVTVNLVNSQNQVIATTTTNQNGEYFFSNMPGDDYQVRFVSDDGTAFTGLDGMGNQNVDGGLNGVTSVTVAYGSGTIRNFQEVNGVAIDPSGVIYDAVSRAPVEGATVRLLFNGNPVNDAWLVGATNTQVTGSDGVYAFFLQDPAQTGVYTIEVDAPAGYLGVTPDAPSSSIAPLAAYDGTQELGADVVEIVPSANPPAIGGDTSYHLTFNLQFTDWTDVSTLSDGVIHNHIPMDRIEMGMKVTKTADVSQLSEIPAEGDEITYTITAENTGIGSYSNVVFNDPLTNDALEILDTNDASGTLDAGETWTWTTTYALTIEDLARGKVENTALITGTTPYGEDETFESSANGNTTPGAGNGSPTVVELSDLIPLIEEDLKAILTDDLAATMRQQSSAMKGYAKSARSRLDTAGLDCGQIVTQAVKNRDINFATDSDVILEQSYPVLDDIAAAIQSCDAGEAISIQGHTDARGSVAYNQDLSERRAVSVKRALVQRDTASDQLRAVGYGETRPVATNDTDEGMALNRRVEFVTVAGAATEEVACSGDSAFDRKTDLQADASGLSAKGRFNKETQNCGGDEWRTTSGQMSLLKTDDGIEQWMFNLSMRQEKRLDQDTVFGWFMGAYGARNQISGLADGTIDGVGVNGGIFGAKRLDQSVFLDYYAGMSGGRHRFDLNFDRGFDINTTGDYRYLAYYGGVAVSGDIEHKNAVISPRAGVDFAYTNGADVTLTASNEFRSETGSTRLDAMDGGRIYGEVKWHQSLQGSLDRDNSLSITPMTFCDRAVGTSSTACGLGAQVEYKSSDLKDGSTLGVILSAERTKDTTSSTFGVNYETILFGGAGSANTTLGLNDDMNPQVGYNLNVEF